MKKTTGKAKKGLVMLLCASMVISVTPMSAMAEEMTTEEVLTSESAGTEETDAEESFISEELTTEEEETGEQGNEEGIQFEDGDTEETWITEEADTDQLTETESFIGESDIDLYAMTEDMPIEDGASVYVLTEKDGAYYDAQGIKYTLSTENGENTATVSGYDKTDIADKYTDEMVAAGNGWEITIPAKVNLGDTEYAVTKIYKEAFRECTQLTKVDFASNSVLTEIGRQAFWGCSSLNQINLPISLTTIGSTSFAYTKLSAIFIPKNVSKIGGNGGGNICNRCSQLQEIKVDPENATYNVGYEKYKDINCIIEGTTILQGCKNSKIPNEVTRLGAGSFCGMDIRNVDFSGCSSVEMGTAAFTMSILPEDWKIPECFSGLILYGNTSLKRVTFHDEYLFLDCSSELHSTFSGCSSIEKVVIPDSTKCSTSWYDDDVFGKSGADNLTVYVGDFNEDNLLLRVLKAHAYEDYTGDKVVTYEKTETRHYILKKAYKVQFDKEYAGYTLAKAKGCTTLTPIPGDSVKFVINSADGYKKKDLKVYVTDDNGTKTILNKDEAGVYTLENVNENNYKICLEGNGVCDHSVNTYTLENSVVTKVCNDCGNVETGKVTAIWRHTNTPYSSVAFSCDNANIKGTFAITGTTTSGGYNYKFTPSDGTYIENEQHTPTITVSSATENMEDTTKNGITYSTVQSETDINKIGNCTVDIYYDSNNSVLHIDGSETYLLSGKSTTDRIVVNNTEPTTLVLNGLDIQMTNLPAIDLQGTAEVKIVLADGTENILTATGDYAALQRNNLAENTPKLIISGPGNLTATATGQGAAIGAEKNKYASNIKFINAQITAKSNRGAVIGNGYGTQLDNSKLSTENYVFAGGVVYMECADENYDISGGITVTDGAVVCGRVVGFIGIDELKEYTKLDGDGFVSRYEVFGSCYTQLKGNVIVDTIFRVDGLTIPEGSTLTVGPNRGQMVLDTGETMTNNGTLIIKGSENNFTGTLDNNGTIYNYEKYGRSIKDKIKTGILHEDVDHDGNCEICGQDIGNIEKITIPSENGSTTIKQNGSFTFSATVTPKDTDSDPTITYQWYKQDSDNSYTKIDSATTSTYTEENSTLAAGTYNYRLEAICDGIIRYIPFTVTVKEPVKYDTHSLTLADEIGVNFFMNIPEYARTEGAYMEFSISGRGGKTTKVKLSDITAETDGRYKFTCPVNALQMAETITATYHYGEKETVENTYSVKQYVETVVKSDSENESVKNLVKALADYGYYAQRCLSEVNGWALDRDYAQMSHYTDSFDMSSDFLRNYAYTCEGEVLGITEVSRSLTLDSKTAINLFFAIDDKLTEVPTVNVLDKDGNTVDCELSLVDNGSRYRLRIPGISAHKIGDFYRVTVNNTMIIQMTALSYAYIVLESNWTTAATKNAMVAMYQYYKAAIDYKMQVN